ncbi:hypothetical protein CSKR_202169, partial [Clonorchis sinensis]
MDLLVVQRDAKSHNTVRIADNVEQDEHFFPVPIQTTSSSTSSAFIAHTVDVRRTSLHGKPLPVRQCRTDVRYRRLQAKLYNFLERPKTWNSMIYHVAV